MEQKTKQWQKPELIVLMRNKPEEAVLAACKGAPTGAGSTGYTQSTCQPDLECNICSDTASS